MADLFHNTNFAVRLTKALSSSYVVSHSLEKPNLEIKLERFRFYDRKSLKFLLFMWEFQGF
jgi:hypothetical protein